MAISLTPQNREAGPAEDYPKPEGSTSQSRHVGSRIYCRATRMHSCAAGATTYVAHRLLYIRRDVAGRRQAGRQGRRRERRRQSSSRSMPRRKVSMGLIPNHRVRATTFGKRKEGLKKKARELATLCGVRIAVVCGATADAHGAGAADVWESEAGVLDAYRELPPEERARHTHPAYAELELRKAETKLVKVRQEGPAALAQWDAAVYALTLDQARRMLEAVDGALRAVNQRWAALGLPVDDDGGWLSGFAAPPGASSDAVAPLGLVAAHPFVGSNLVSFDGGGYLQLRAQGGGVNGNNEHVVWDDTTNNNNGFDPRSAGMVQQPAGYAFQQRAAVDMDGYTLQMAAETYGNSSNATGRLAWDAAFQPLTNELAAAMQQPHGYGFQFTGNSYVGMSAGYLGQQTPGSNSIVPVGYPSLETSYNFMDTPAAHAAAAAQGIGGSSFNAALPALSLTMGTGDNYVSAPQVQPLAVSYNGDLIINASDYASTQWSAGQLQSDGSSQQSSNKSLWEAL